MTSGLFDTTTGVPDVSDRPLVPVLVPVALDQTYDYLVPASVELGPGAFVLVPLGSQNRMGIVWDRAIGDAKPIAGHKLKTIAAVLDAPPLPAISMRFAEWVANYTLAPLGMVARMMMSAPAAFEAEKPRYGVRLAAGVADPPRMSQARERALEVATDGQIRTKAALAREAGCTSGVIDGLVASGNLVDVAIPEKVFQRPNPSHDAVNLTPDQEQAAEAVRAAVGNGTFSVALLDGVTGSGKTEVYFEAVARTLQAGKQALILLPEIALTSQFTSRYQARFGAPAVEWHSTVSSVERGRVWRAVATGAARVIVGARSALFLPFENLGLIVVDEEHDAGFKQDDRVHYQGRDMAVVRASLGGFPAILASATPSVESQVNAKTARYRHVVLPSRFTGVELPAVETIDLRLTPPEHGRWLSAPLVKALVETRGEGQQSLLYLNRRGYAPLTLCRTCGHRLECPQCTAWLVEHRFRKRLNCHHCGFSLPLPEKCPKCFELGPLVACGPGVERVAEEVRERFPDATIAILSSDLIPSLTEMREVIRRIEAREADIIIGTQIVAKGHNFPGLATVGIVDGDLGLAHGADPRAAERTFQLLYQVTGRAGRGFARGRGFVQTYDPTHPVMDAIVTGDRNAFLEREIVVRRNGLLPPFGRLAALVVTGRDKASAAGFARELARCAPPAERLSVLGPAEAPIAIVRGRYRWRLLVKAPRDIDLQAYLRAWLKKSPLPKGDLRLDVDIDPYSFL